MFSSCHRLHDLFRADAQEIYEEFTEVEIDGNLEDLLERGWTWNEFHSFVSGKVVWTARNTYVAVRSRQQYSISGFHDAVLSINTTFWGQKLAVYAPTPAEAKYTLDTLLLLLAVSDIPHLEISADFELILPVSTSALEYFLTQNQSVQRLCFERLSLNEEHCRTLATTGGENNRTIDLKSCRLNDEGAAFVESIRENKGPSSLSFSRLGMSHTNLLALTEALGTTSCLRTLELKDLRLSESQMYAFAKAFKNNVGLVSVDLAGNEISDNNWEVLTGSIRIHDSLECVRLERTSGSAWISEHVLSSERKKQRTLSILAMLETNVVLKGIQMSTNEIDHETMPMIDARLVINRNRRRVRALVKVDNHARGFVLQQAVIFVRLYPDLIWMILSQNIDVVCNTSTQHESRVLQANNTLER
jgi:hypothetical protein